MAHLPPDYGACMRACEYDFAFMEFLRKRGHTCMLDCGGDGVVWCERREECVMPALAMAIAPVPKKKKAPAKRITPTPATPKKRKRKRSKKSLAVLVRLKGPSH
jgi:hypothetical protein